VPVIVLVRVVHTLCTLPIFTLALPKGVKLTLLHPLRLIHRGFDLDKESSNRFPWSLDFICRVPLQHGISVYSPLSNNYLGCLNCRICRRPLSFQSSRNLLPPPPDTDTNSVRAPSLFTHESPPTTHRHTPSKWCINPQRAKRKREKDKNQRSGTRNLGTSPRVSLAPRPPKSDCCPVVLANDLVLFHVSDGDAVVHVTIMIEQLVYCNMDGTNTIKRPTAGRYTSTM
jgi:hypothetical protein